MEPSTWILSLKVSLSKLKLCYIITQMLTVATYSNTWSQCSIGAAIGKHTLHYHLQSKISEWIAAEFPKSKYRDHLIRRKSVLFENP